VRIKSSPKTLAKRRIMRELTALVREIVFARDGHKCVFDGSTSHLQACHVLPKNRAPRLRFEPYNVFCGCADCHLRWHGDPKYMLVEFERLFPGRYETLEIANRNAPKLDYKMLRIALEIELQAEREHIPWPANMGSRS